MKTGKTMHLSPRAVEILRAATIDDQRRLHLPGPPPDPEMYREIKTALEALGWRSGRYFEPIPDPVTALAVALATGEVNL